MTQNDRAVLQQIKRDLTEALLSDGTTWTDYSRSRLRAAITQVNYLLDSCGQHHLAETLSRRA